MNYLSLPGLVRACWQSVAVYPVVESVSRSDGYVPAEYADPLYIHSISRLPVEVVSRGLSGLQETMLLRPTEGGWFLTRPHDPPARVGAPSPPDPGAHNARGGGPALVCTEGADPADRRTPAITHARGEFEDYLERTWGDLVTRGKPLETWAAVQQEAHPTMDLLAEAKKARAWEMGQKKQKTSIRRFLGNWFNRAESFEKETVIRATADQGHWSGMSRRAKTDAVNAGRSEVAVVVNGVSINRSLKDDLFILSGQNMTNGNLQYRERLVKLIKQRFETSSDPHDPAPLLEALRELGAKPESDRAMQWAIGQLVTDVRYDLGLLPV